jgi:hypothetical protein
MKKKPLVNLMLDSGVFSAWTRGTSLDVGEYIKYVKANERFFWSYVNMDVIPGSFGKARTRAEVEHSAKQSYENLCRMKDAGLTPIPVYHQGESIKWLEKLLLDGEKYIGISTAKDLSLPEHVAWLDQVFTMITDPKGRPLVKTHGFGITRPNLMLRYPWFTCDSTTWTLSPGFGQVMIPIYDKGVKNYDLIPMTVILTHRTREEASNAKRFQALGPLEQQMVMRFLAECNVSLEHAIYHPDSRRRVMLRMYNEFSTQHKIQPFAHARGSLEFEVKSFDIKPVPRWENVTVMLATNLNRAWAKIMNELGSHNRLLNYWELREKSPEVLHEYVLEGVNAGHRLKKPKQDWGEHYSTYRRMKILERLARDQDDGTENSTGQA